MSTSYLFQSPQWRDDDDDDGFLEANETFFFDARPVLDPEGVDLNTVKAFQFNEIVSVVDASGKVTEAPLARGDGFWNTLQYEHEIGALYGASYTEFNQSLSFQEIAQDYGTASTIETGSESLSLIDLRASTNSIEDTNNPAEDVVEADSGSMSIGNIFEDGDGGGIVREVGSLFSRAAQRLQGNDNDNDYVERRAFTDDDDDDNSFNGNDSTLNDSQRFNTAQNAPILPNGLTAQ
jgi:hypothetical protein